MLTSKKWQNDYWFESLHTLSHFPWGLQQTQIKSCSSKNAEQVSYLLFLLVIWSSSFPSRKKLMHSTYVGSVVNLRSDFFSNLLAKMSFWPFNSCWYGFLGGRRHHVSQLCLCNLNLWSWHSGTTINTAASWLWSLCVLDFFNLCFAVFAGTSDVVITLVIVTFAGQT